MFSFRMISLAIAGAMLLVGQAQAAALIATDPGETLQNLIFSLELLNIILIL